MIIDERSGVIVMGDNVRISTVAIAQGNLTIRVTETPQVSQPSPFSNTGNTVVVPRTQIDVNQDEGKKLAVVRNGVSLQELVNGLNALGIGPRDMITILQAIKAAGALQADAGADRIDPIPQRRDRYLGALASLACNSLDLNQALVDFRHFHFKQAPQHVRMSA